MRRIHLGVLVLAASMPGVCPGSARAQEGNLGVLTVPGSGDWSALAIEAMNVEVTISGRHARTSVTQVFRNHYSWQTEGRYRFTLPEGAAISRLAMDVAGVMMEGELVEKRRRCLPSANMELVQRGEVVDGHRLRRLAGVRDRRLDGGDETAMRVMSGYGGFR